MAASYILGRKGEGHQQSSQGPPLGEGLFLTFGVCAFVPPKAASGVHAEGWKTHALGKAYSIMRLGLDSQCKGTLSSARCFFEFLLDNFEAIATHNSEFDLFFLFTWCF